MLVRLSRTLFVSIALIRARATGMEVRLPLLATCVLRVAKKAILSQFEVGAGLVPAAALWRDCRASWEEDAHSSILSADDVSGDLAERYGYVNRSYAGCRSRRVCRCACHRIASFDKQTIMDTKRLVNIASLPPDIEIESGWNACVASMGRPATQQRIKTLLERGFLQPAMQKIAWEISWDRVRIP